MPGGRDSAVSWIDSSGSFWLFGGFGTDAQGKLGSLNDLWEFDPLTNDWAWMSGTNTVGSKGGQPGIYGTLGTPAAGNVPGGRARSASWIDGSGRLWLFGGEGFDASGNVGWLNDLWRFDPSTNEWVWISGSNTVVANGGQPGIYGTLGTPAAGNVPGGRASSASWIDSSGRLWLFGGSGYDAADNIGDLNDLRRFDPSTNEWVWIGGSETVPGTNTGQPGIYGKFGNSRRWKCAGRA